MLKVKEKTKQNNRIINREKINKLQIPQRKKKMFLNIINY
jgi:hypothetical protein